MIVLGTRHENGVVKTKLVSYLFAPEVRESILKVLPRQRHAALVTPSWQTIGELHQLIERVYAVVAFLSVGG